MEYQKLMQTLLDEFRNNFYSWEDANKSMKHVMIMSMLECWECEWRLEEEEIALLFDALKDYYLMK